MKNLLFIAAMLLSTASFCQVYCSSSGLNPNPSYISNVTVNGVFNGGSTYTTGYSYYSLPVSFNAGTSYTITVTNVRQVPSTSTYYYIWMDFNKNGSFADAGETILTNTYTTNPSASTNFTVPAGTKGTIRIRVAASFYQLSSACGNFNYGEVEDYSLNVNCPLPPALGGGGYGYCLNPFNHTRQINMHTTPPAGTNYFYRFYYHGIMYGGSYDGVLNFTTYMEQAAYSGQIEYGNACGTTTITIPITQQACREGENDESELSDLIINQTEQSLIILNKQLTNLSGSIRDTKGQVVKVIDSGSSETILNTSNLQNGIYILEISNGQKNLKKKIIITK